MRLTPLAAGLVLTAAASSAFAQAAPPASPTPAVASTTPSGHYSAATTDLGTMLDDPAAKAVLVKDIPTIVGNDQIDMARGMTLKDLQQYSPDLTDQKLAAIDADLAALPAKK